MLGEGCPNDHPGFGNGLARSQVKNQQRLLSVFDRQELTGSDVR